MIKTIESVKTEKGKKLLKKYLEADATSRQLFWETFQIHHFSISEQPNVSKEEPINNQEGQQQKTGLITQIHIIYFHRNSHI